jgi:hypothetical protein
VFVNGHEIICCRAKNRFQIFVVLFDQYISDKKRTRDTTNFRFLSLKEISAILNKAGFYVSDLEKQVRLPIYKIMEKVPDLIEFRKWAGCCDKNFGYRLNPKFIRIGT